MRDEPRPRPEEPLVLVEHDLPVSSTGATLRRAPLSRTEQLPGHDVGVVLQAGEDDLVPLADVAPPPALRHEVDPLGRAAHEDNLACAESALRKRAHLLARCFIGVGGARRQGVGGAVDVGVLVLVEAGEPIDDRARLLRGGGVVEPDQLPAVHALVQDGEVFA